MKTLVTGGAGFIGSNLVDALLSRGDEVVALDNLVTGKRENLDQAIENGARLVEGDIRNADAVRELVTREEPEVIFHLAAQMDVRVSTARPAYDADVNVVGTVNMLEVAREAGVRRLVNTSTGGAIYGEADVIPTPESAPIQPEAPYGQAKYAAEGYCELYGRLHGLSTVSMRLGNVYGPRQDPRGEAGVVAIFCGRLLGHERPTVYGDGLQTRDYIHAGEVVAAMLAAAATDERGAFNVGRGVETSVIDLVDVLRAAGNDLGLSPDGFEPEFAPPRKGELQRSALDPSKAREQLAFEAKVLVEDGLRSTLETLL